MGKAYEIERKFLVEFPNVDKLDVRKTIGIIQTYLANGENNSQRRVRRMSVNGEVSYTYTEKIFLTRITREENERFISRIEYEDLLKQARNDVRPVEKTRYAFNYHDQLFELDTYPFSDKLAIMELEMETPEQEIDFPDSVNVIRDVSDDIRYSNSALATAGCFPTDKIGEYT